MIEHNDKSYELKFNIKRIEMIEEVTGNPIMASFQKNRGMFGITELKTYIAYGLKEIGADVFINPKKGLEIAEQYIEEKGYAEAVSNLMDAVERDCPFFFQAG